MDDILLDVRDLSVSFRGYGGTVRAVRGVSFHLRRGETLAIVGESGSGKSVSIKSVLGILPKNARVDTGEILYGGMDLAKAGEAALHEIRGKRIGLVFQDPLSALNPIMRVGKQIAEVMIRRGMRRGEARERALQLMRDVGIPDAERRIDLYPFQLSGGMRQRVVIAIALAGEPEILICDEPTTALDVTVQAKILELINRLKEERNLSVIFITHDLGVVAQMADRIAVMYAGKIVETGTAEEIFFDPRHPYTWALLSSMPDLETKERLTAIPGAPPNMLEPIVGDAFAPRNRYALKIDFEREPPTFRLGETHLCASWLLHEKAPKVPVPEELANRIARMKEAANRVS